MERLSAVEGFLRVSARWPGPRVQCWVPGVPTCPRQHFFLRDCRRGCTWAPSLGGSGLAQEAGAQAFARGALTKAVLVEVAAAAGADRASSLAPAVLEVWVGLLRAELGAAVSYEAGSPEQSFGNDPHGQPLFPHSAALTALVQEHFAFHSAKSGAGLEQPAGELAERVSNLEDATTRIAKGVQVLVVREPSIAGRPSGMHVGLGAQAKTAVRRPKTEASFQHLDPGSASLGRDGPHGWGRRVWISCAYRFAGCGGQPRAPLYPSPTRSLPS